MKSMLLNEKSRNELISQSRVGRKERDGKNRYEKRLKSSFSTSTQDYNQIDMNEFFKEDILTVKLKIKGETDNYIVTIKFSNILENLQKELERPNSKLDLSLIVRTLINTFNNNKDVYVGCTCPDFKYRLQYSATKGNYNAISPQLIPANITNPNNDLGAGCKHILLVLSNTSWLLKVASVLWNYIKYFEKSRQKQYADIIYPKLYGKKYEEPVQLTMFDDGDDLASEEDEVSGINKIGSRLGRGRKRVNNLIPNYIKNQNKDI